MTGREYRERAGGWGWRKGRELGQRVDLGVRGERGGHRERERQTDRQKQTDRLTDNVLLI